MQEVQTILVVILSIGFVILLIMGIAMVVILIKIMTNIRRITQRLDETTENMGEMAKYVGNKVAPAAMSALGAVLMRSAKSKFKRGKRDE
jgi:hypothetical protein